MSYVLGMNTAVPEFAIGRQDFERFVADQSKADTQLLRKLRWLAEKSGIETRYAALPDYQSPENALLYYRKGTPFQAGIGERMALYADLALRMSVNAAKALVDRFGVPTHLIYTSCTGLSAPGIEMSLLRALKLPANVFRHSVNFMGCYAALHALRTAHYICAAEPHARVLVVCTELCSLHYQDALHDDALLANLLFGDGSAAVYMTAEAGLHRPMLELKDFYSELLPGGESDMSWALGEASFAMRLSSYVPQLLSAHIGTALQSAGAKWQQAPDQGWNWAIHPGGKTILDQLGRELGLTDEQLSPSRGVLREFGNMSSASVLFVLQKILNQGELAQKPTVLAAFGPGLSVEMAYAVPFKVDE